METKVAENLVIKEHLGSILEETSLPLIHPVSFDGKFTSNLSRQIHDMFDIKSEFLQCSQRTCPGLCQSIPIINAVRQGQRPQLQEIVGFSNITRSLWHQFQSLTIKDGLLYRRFEHVTKDQRFFWWPGMTNDVISVVSNCEVCKRFKTPKHPIKNAELKIFREYFM